jgi:drug/metabolite transporter (DMT)-like permease
VRVSWSAGLVGAILFCGIFASALAIGVQTWAQARTSAVRAALIFALEPVFATSLSVMLGREQLGTREVIGGLLTVLAVVAAEVGNAWMARRAPPRLGPFAG